jgi:hypothetical protein
MQFRNSQNFLKEPWFTFAWHIGGYKNGPFPKTTLPWADPNTLKIQHLQKIGS